MNRNFEVFWGEMSPCDHSIQIYEGDSFLDALEGFVGGGLQQGESTIVIATLDHRESLQRRLEARGLDDLGQAESQVAVVLNSRAGARSPPR